MRSSSGGAIHCVAYLDTGSYLLACSGCAIKLFSTETGVQVRLLEGHTDCVTAVAQSRASSLQAYSAGLDGRIVLWDLDEANILRVICVGLPVLSMVLNPSDPYGAFLLTSSNAQATTVSVPMYCRAQVSAGRVYSVSLRVSQTQAAWAAKQMASSASASGRQKQASAAGGSGGSAGEGGDGGDSGDGGGGATLGSLMRPWPAEVMALFKAKGATVIAVGLCGGTSPVVGALAGIHLRLHDVGSGRTHDVSQRREMSCMAVSPTQPLAATGDDSGRISIWHTSPPPTGAVGGGGSGGSGNGAPTHRMSEYHWHAQRVGAVAFAPDGMYLYSAGKEGVLVSWQLSTDQRAYLPRLGAPLLQLDCTPDGTRAALLGSDNSVRLVDLRAMGSPNALKLTVHGLLQATRMAPDRRLRAMVLHGGGAGGRLQWWSPGEDRQLQELEVAPRNISGSLPRLGGTDEMRRALRSTAAAGGAALVQVTLTCLSHDGRSLASIESRSDAELRQNATLKMWHWMADGQWELSARVAQPHQGEVCALAFHPSSHLVVSAATDAKFKLWEGVEQPQPLGADGGDGSSATARVVWACRSVGYYRQTAATAAAFSVDGSLLAVAYAPDVVTLWDPMSNAMLQSFCQPLADPQDQLCFVGFPGTGGRLLAHSSSVVQCWDLLSGSMAWMHAATAVLAAAVDPQSDAMMVAVGLSANEAAGSGTLPAERKQSTIPLAEACDAYAVLEFGVASDAACDSGGSVPRRSWQLGGSTPPRAVGYLPEPAGRRGSPLALSASGDLFRLSLSGDGASAEDAVAAANSTTDAMDVSDGAGGAGGAGGGDSDDDGAAGAPKLSTARSRLASVFGVSAARNTTRDALDRLTAETANPVGDGLAGGDGAGGEADEEDDSALQGAANDYSPGWEARGLDAWLKKNIDPVPSHLLPPMSEICDGMLKQCMRPAPHLPQSKGVSELRRATLVQAVRNGTVDTYKAEMRRLTALIQQRWSQEDEKGAKKTERKLLDAALSSVSLAPPTEPPAAPSEPSSAQHAQAADAPRPARSSKAQKVRKASGGGGGGGAADMETEETPTQPVDAVDAMDTDAATGEGAPGESGAAASTGGPATARRGGAATAKATAPRGGPPPAVPPRPRVPPVEDPDLCGSQRNYANMPPATWVAASAGGVGDDEIGALDGDDLAFWKENAYKPDDLAAFRDWLVNEAALPLPIFDGAPSDTEEEGEEESASDSESAATAHRYREETFLPNSNGKSVAEEIREAEDFLEMSKLKIDKKGFGLAPFAEQTEAIAFARQGCPPLPADYQDEPEKGEWAMLVKEHARRKKAGASEIELEVIAEAVRASGVRAAGKLAEPSRGPAAPGADGNAS